MIQLLRNNHYNFQSAYDPLCNIQHCTPLLFKTLCFLY